MLKRMKEFLVVITVCSATVSCSSESNNGTVSADIGTDSRKDTSTSKDTSISKDTSQNADSDLQTKDTSGVDADVDTKIDTPDMRDMSITNTPLGEWCIDAPEEFSFFVTSMDALWILSGSTAGDLNGGFGGDFGGIEGADEICQTIGKATGFDHKTWRAFLSATDDGNGNPINAIERIGTGPWVDANGRTVATGIDGLLAADRPDGDAQTIADLPDECGLGLSLLGNAHDIVTGTDRQGMAASDDMQWTCNDWTSSDGNVGGGNIQNGLLRSGHSFPRSGNVGRGANWMSDHALRGCGKGANLVQDGAGSGTCIGCSGGYGALYCFAL